MATLIVEIDTERDLPALEAILTRMGLEFEVEEDDDDNWGDLSDAEIGAIKAGMEDFKNGRVVSHADAMTQIEDHLNKRKARV